MKIIKQDNLSKSEKNVAIMLEEHEDFGNVVKFFRLSLGINSQGESFQNPDHVMSQIDKEKLNNAVNFILTRYQFPNNWFNFFSNILVFGVATKPSVFELRYYSPKGIKTSKPELHIVLSGQVSKKNVKDAIDKSKDLVKYLTILPKVNDLSKITIAEDYQKFKNSKLDVNDKDEARRKRVSDIKYEFRQYMKKVLGKKNIEERIIQTMSLRP